jgi:hypothetical protein
MSATQFVNKGCPFWISNNLLLKPLKIWLQIAFHWGLETLGWFHNDKRLLVVHGIVV